jgi:hypothetical protein
MFGKPERNNCTICLNEVNPLYITFPSLSTSLLCLKMEDFATYFSLSPEEEIH